MYRQLSAPQPLLLLIGATSAHPNAPGLISWRYELKFSQLQSIALRVAEALRQLGIGPRDRVLLHLPNDTAAIISWSLMALNAVGGVLPSTQFWPAMEQVDWILTSEPNDEMPSRHSVLIDDAFMSSALADSSDVRFAAYASAEEPCRIIYTSGTTGSPVAVELSVKQLALRAQHIERIWATVHPSFSLISLAGTHGLYSWWNAAATNTPYLVPATAPENATIIQREYVGTLIGSPAQLRSLARVITESRIEVQEIARIYATGAHVSTTLKQLWATLTPATFLSLYGTTEVGTVAHGEIIQDQPTVFVLGGEHVTVEVVDSDHCVLGPGEQGILRLRSDSVVSGYRNLARPGTFQDGFFYPGDLARMIDETHFELLGRRNEILNAGGQKVEPGSLDDIALAIPGVRDAAVFMDAAGEEQPILALCCDSEATAEAAVKAINTAQQGVTISTAWRVSEIPRGDTGKAQRARLAKLWQEARGPDA